MMPEEESEVSFANFGGSKRLRAISAKPPTKTPRAPKWPRALGTDGARDRSRGDRTFKLSFSTTSGYGRYAKSLGGSPSRAGVGALFALSRLPEGELSPGDAEPTN